LLGPLAQPKLGGDKCTFDLMHFYWLTPLLGTEVEAYDSQRDILFKVIYLPVTGRFRWKKM
jgi:hypothetical protein